MKRIAVGFALALLLLSTLPAQQRLDAPTLVCEEARIGFYVSGSPEFEQDEDGAWNAYDEPSGLVITVMEADKYVAPKMVGEKTLMAAIGDEEIEDFTFLAVRKEDAVTYAYGQGSALDDDGEAFEFFAGLLTNADVPKRSFVFMIMAQSLTGEKSGEAADYAVNNIISMGPAE